MALNLSRNTKMFVSTVATGNVAANTWEVPVLDGYSFSQEAESQTITLNEAGQKPVRGQKIFNTALNPAELEIPTYIRPFYSTTHKGLEQVLWEALAGPGPVGTYAKPGANYMEVNFKGSDVHELLKLYVFFKLDNTTYRVNQVAVGSVEIDFSIEDIAMGTWTCQGATIDEVDTTAWVAGVDYTAANANAKFIKNKLSSISLRKTTGTTSGYQQVDYNDALDPTVTADLTNSTSYSATIAVDGGSAQTITVLGATGKTVEAVIAEINYQLTGAVAYIYKGNLRVVSSKSGSTTSISITDGGTPLFATLDSNYTAIDAAVAGTGTPKIYNMPITGGSLTIENNVTYLTPEELGKVNVPIGSFTGTRAIDGSLTAYLNTGSNNTGGLLTDLLADTSTVTQEFEMTISMGGGSNTPRVDFIMNHAHLVIPSVNVEDVLSTEINFTALGELIDINDELVVRYYAQ